MPETTKKPSRDHFFDGRIVLFQPRFGYRFSIDAVILAHRISPAAGETVLDLGTGCGVIPVMLAFRHPQAHLVGVEIQAALAALARRNVTANQMTDRICIVEKDMAEVTQADIGGPVDVVVTNPPYRKQGSGRINIDSQRAVARHELKIDLATVLDTARRMLRRSGRFHIVYPSVRGVDLLATMRATGLEPKILTMIHATAASPAQLVAVMGIHGGRPGLEVTPPLQLYNDDGTYTGTLAAMCRA